MDLVDMLQKANAANSLVVASVNDTSSPEAALVEFGVSGSAIVFYAFLDSRKCKNFAHNPKVAIVINPSEDETIQIEGTVRSLGGESLKIAQEDYFAKIPEARKWANKEGIGFFAVDIKWFRYTNVSTQPWTVEEAEA